MLIPDSIREGAARVHRTYGDRAAQSLSGYGPVDCPALAVSWAAASERRPEVQWVPCQYMWKVVLEASAHHMEGSLTAAVDMSFVAAAINLVQYQPRW